MAAPRILFAPTHFSTAPLAVAAALTEVVARQGRSPRFHRLGAGIPAQAWDRRQGSVFLDRALYDEATLLELYETSTREADFSLLATDHGLFDPVGPSPQAGASWTPADAARSLGCPVVLFVDVRGWGEGLGPLVTGFNERASRMDLVAVVAVGVEDGDHRQAVQEVLKRAGLPLAGFFYADGAFGWNQRPPGLGAALDDGFLEEAFARVDVAGLERLAGQQVFLPGGGRAAPSGAEQTTIAVAGGRGFTLWSRDSVEVLRRAGARVVRLDLVEDATLPESTSGLVLAGHLWPEALAEVTSNYPLMREIRVRIAEGLPTIALGGGMHYLLRSLQAPDGRRYEMVGLLPAEGELIGELPEPEYYRLRALRDNVLLGQGAEITGWMTADADLMETPVTRNFAFSVIGGHQERHEGAASSGLLCSQILLHLASEPAMARRFVDSCRAHVAEAAG